MPIKYNRFTNIKQPMKNVNCASSHLRTFSRRFIIRASLVFLYSVIPTPIPERQQKTSEHCVHFTNKCVENIYNDLLQHNRSSNNSTTVRCTGDLKSNISDNCYTGCYRKKYKMHRHSTITSQSYVYTEMFRNESKVDAKEGSCFNTVNNKYSLLSS